VLLDARQRFLDTVVPCSTAAWNAPIHDAGLRAAWIGSMKRMPSRDSPRFGPTGSGAVRRAHRASG
jgi:hypothetical protein